MEASEMEGEQSVFIPDGRRAEPDEEEEEEDEDMYSERDPLVLDEWEIERAASPAPSYLSMESEDMDIGESGISMDQGQTGIELARPDSAVSSIYSLESDEGVDDPLKPQLALRKRPKTKTMSAAKPELYVDPDYKRHPALSVKFTLKFIPQLLKKLNEVQLRFFKKYLWERYPEYFRDPLDCLDLLDVADNMVECCDLEVAVNITRHIFQYMQATKLISYMDEHLHRNEVRYALKEELKQQYGTMYEGGAENERSVDFESAYTELFMTQGRYAPANHEHELRGDVEKLKLEARSLNRMKAKRIEALYDQKEVEDRYMRLVILRGITGIGKTTAVQRFVLDWANDRNHEEIFFLFPLSGRKLLRRLDEEVSWRELLSELYPSAASLQAIEYEDCTVMYILDDTDELLHDLDFVYTFCFCDQDTRTQVRNMIINLIKGNLQMNSFVLLTAAPLASCQVPSDRIHQVCEIRGFLDDDRHNYFRNRYRAEPDVAERFVSYLNANPTLLIMCYHPLFCWVVSQVMEKVFRKYPPGEEPQGMLTEVYAHLLQVYLKKREHKRQWQQPHVKDKKWEDERQMIMSLGRWAFTMLEKEQFELLSGNWKDEECDAKEALLRSGVCTEYWREAFILYSERFRSFIQPTLQEFLAALYVFLNFKNNNKNILDTSKLSMIRLSGGTLADLYRCAMDRVVQSKATLPCHWDLFTRFLIGLGAESNQRILGRLFNQVGFKASAVEDARRAIQKKIKENPDKAESLEKCLQELNKPSDSSRH